MSRPPLAPEARRQRVDLTLAPTTIVLLDALVQVEGTTRSALVEKLLLREFQDRPRQGEPGYRAPARKRASKR